MAVHPLYISSKETIRLLALKCGRSPQLVSEVNNRALGLGTEDACKLPEPGMALARLALCTVTNPFVVLMRFEVFGWEVYKLQICSFQTDAQPGWTHGCPLAQEPDQDMVEQLWGWAWWGAAVQSKGTV